MRLVNNIITVVLLSGSYCIYDTMEAVTYLGAYDSYIRPSLAFPLILVGILKTLPVFFQS